MLLIVALALAGAATANSPTVAIYSSGLSGGSGPNDIALGPDGAMWFTEYDGDKIGRIDTAGSIVEDPPGGSPPLAPGADPAGIVSGPNGELFFSEFASGGNGAIGELDPGTGQLVGEYPTPTAGSEPDGIAVGSDGGVWFAEQGTVGTVGRIDPTTHTIDEYDVVVGTHIVNSPTSIVTGPDGALWITLLGTGRIARLDPNAASPGTNQGVTLYDLPSGSSAEPEGIAVGADGDLYVAEYGADQIAKLDPNAVSPGTSNGITEYPAGGAPLELTAATDGGVWATEPQSNAVVRFDPQSDTVTSTLAGAQGLGGGPTGIADDGNGHVWFTEFNAPAIGAVTLSGGGTTTTTSTSSGPVPSNTQQPFITGTQQAGQPLICHRGVWTTYGTGLFTEAWFETQVRPGAIHVPTTLQVGTGGTFTLPDYPPGATIYCTVTAANANGTVQKSAVAVTMLPTKPVLALPLALHARPAPTIDSGLGLGATNTCSRGSWLHYPSSYRFAWYVVPGPNSPLSAGTKVGTRASLKIAGAEQNGYLVCAVTASNGAGSTLALSNRYWVVEPDLGWEVNAMEVTQGIQTSEIPTRSATSPAANHVSYHGVVLPWEQNTTPTTPTTALLAAAHATVVRVYVNTTVPIGANAVPPMTLTAYSGGKVLPPGPIQPDLPLPPTSSLPVGALGLNPGTTAQADKAGAYEFTLPLNWTQGDVTFEAQVDPSASALPQCVACTIAREERTLYLGPEHFNPVSSIQLEPIAMTVNNGAGNVLYPAGYPGPDPAWSQVQAVQPQPISIPSYETTLDATSWVNAASITTTTCTLLVFCSSTTITPTSPNNAFYSAQSNEMLAEVEAWADAHDPNSAYFPYGIIPATPRYSGGTSRTLNGYVLYGPHQPWAVASDDRPISGMAHEMGHALGLVHADQTCGGNANGQIAEPWPPNNDGALDGIGLNTDSGTLPYATIQSTSSTPIYDLMSYCTNGAEANAWISVRNWNREVQANAPGPVHSVRRTVTSSASSGTAATVSSQGFSLSPPASTAAAGTLAITALDELASNQTTISWVLPDSGSPTPVVAGDQYSLVGRDASGNVVATAGATATLIHTEFAPSEVMIQGKLPAAGVRRIDVLDGSQAIARYAASPHAPTVSFPSSLAGSRVGGPHGAVLRWSSHDADGGPLTVYARYSPDGGARWQTVYIGPDRGSVVLPSGQLAASRDARLRIYVSDGFNEAIATSARFTAVGAPPVVSIERPGHTIRLLAGAPLQLLGSAYDDRGVALRGRALFWRAGRRGLGRGTEAMTASLPAGRYSVTLSARDRLGRIGTATVRVTILPAPPIVTKLRAPRRLSPRARSITVRLATLDPATVSAGRVRRITGRRPIAIRVAVRPGRAALAVVLVLRSGGYRVRVPLLLAR